MFAQKPSLKAYFTFQMLCNTFSCSHFINNNEMSAFIWISNQNSNLHRWSWVGDFYCAMILKDEWNDAITVLIESITRSILRKGALIKSYLISIALITAGFKMFQQIDLYMLPTINTQKCVSLYFVYVKISLVHSSSTRCVLSSSTRCVFKIYNVTRFKLYWQLLDSC